MIRLASFPPRAWLPSPHVEMVSVPEQPVWSAALGERSQTLIKDSRAKGNQVPNEILLSMFSDLKKKDLSDYILAIFENKFSHAHLPEPEKASIWASGNNVILKMKTEDAESCENHGDITFYFSVVYFWAAMHLEMDIKERTGKILRNWKGPYEELGMWLTW